jgi:hypothetical protein
MKSGKLLLVGGLGIVGLGLYGFGKKSKSKNSTRKPVVVTIPFQNGGESIEKLRKGDRIVVTYDQAQPWAFTGQPAGAVGVVEVPPPGTVEFLVTRTLDADSVAQVYVQAVDPSGNLVGEHKITVLGS